MKKVYRSLTQDQKNRGVVFSSQLKVLKGTKKHPKDGDIKEVKYNDPDKFKKIKLLKDDSFFNTSHWNYNFIRQ